MALSLSHESSIVNRVPLAVSACRTGSVLTYALSLALMICRQQSFVLPGTSPAGERSIEDVSATLAVPRPSRWQFECDQQPLLCSWTGTSPPESPVSEKD